MINVRSFTRWLPACLVLLAVVLCSGPATASTIESLGSGGPSADLVSRAQARLQHDGYLKAGTYTSGSFDSATIEALERFQTDHFVPASGALDPDSIALLTTHARIGGGLAAGRTPQESVAGVHPRSVPQEEETVTLAARSTVRQDPGRTMPETAGSSLPVVAAGALLLAAGTALLLRRS
jgi:peptidoglycan hydrolase-like protein with peptidoglycan-binding domain